MSEASGKRVELTVRGLILGCLITVVFTAANVYLGLKIGLTFATSIPAAVISMAVLKFFRDSTIPTLQAGPGLLRSLSSARVSPLFRWRDRPRLPTSEPTAQD